MPQIDTVEPLKAETGHFLDIIQGKEAPLSSGLHGLKVVQVLEKACESLKLNGQSIDLKFD